MFFKCFYQFIFVILVTFIASSNSQSFGEFLEEFGKKTFDSLVDELKCSIFGCKTTTKATYQATTQRFSWWQSGNQPNNKELGRCVTGSGRQGTCKASCKRNSFDATQNQCLLSNGQIGVCCLENSDVNFPTLTTTTRLPWWRRQNVTRRTTTTTLQPWRWWWQQGVTQQTTTRTIQQSHQRNKLSKKQRFYKFDQLGCGIVPKKSSRKKRQSSSDSVSYIVGGSNVVIGTHPWFVAVGEIKPNGFIAWDCGGTAINNKWVLTSAHCLYRVDANRVRLFVGGGHLTSDGTFKNIRISRFVIHPNYRGSLKDVRNDIALIQASSSLETTPICLRPDNHQIWPSSGSIGLVLGYGYGYSRGQISDTLKEAKVEIVSKSKCIQSYGNLVRESNDLFCARGKVIENPQANLHLGAVFDACQGDSGGPMVKFHRENFRNVYSIIGVIAGGKGCGHQQFPGIYIDLKQHNEWIINTIVQ